MKTSKDRGIVRIDQPEKYNHGWWVRRRRGAKMFSRFFADKKHGGKNKARVAAREFNDELTGSLPPVSRRRSSKATSSRNGGKGMTARASAKGSTRTKARSSTKSKAISGSGSSRVASKAGSFRFMQNTTRLPQRRRRFAVAR